MPRPKPIHTPPSLTTRARLLGIGGQRADGSPDVGRIAARVGRSERSVRRWLQSGKLPKAAASEVAAIEKAEAHRPRWVAAADEGPVGRSLMGTKQRNMPATQDVRGSLLAAFQRSDGSIDTRRAAGELGVSQRTVQRWAKGQARPKVDHQQAIRAAVRKSTTTGNKRTSRLANQGAAVELKAEIQVSSDTRTRRIGHQQAIRLSGAEMQRVTAAYQSGGDAAANRELARAVANSRYGREIGLDATSVRRVSEVRFK